MAKKQPPTDTPEPLASPLADAIKDSAQQIWQAGLGAFSKVQADGSKAFEALVKDGVALQRQTQSSAEAKLSEASSKISHLAADFSSRASGQWDKLESIFEDRVAKALNKLGVPSAKEVSALVARVDELSARVNTLTASTGKVSVARKLSARASAKTPAPAARQRVATKPKSRRPSPSTPDAPRGD